jgi:acyl-coenzyme A synthetase/AMP-(fatty) acid ligase
LRTSFGPRAARRTAVDDILASVRSQLPDYKLPELIKTVAEIPRNALGKIERKLLPAMMAEGRTEEIASAR